MKSPSTSYLSLFVSKLPSFIHPIIYICPDDGVYLSIIILPLPLAIALLYGPAPFSNACDYFVMGKLGDLSPQGSVAVCVIIIL